MSLESRRRGESKYPKGIGALTFASAKEGSTKILGCVAVILIEALIKGGTSKFEVLEAQAQHTPTCASAES